MSKLYLQNIVDDISFENLPAKWQGFDFDKFSKETYLLKPPTQAGSKKDLDYKLIKPLIWWG